MPKTKNGATAPSNVIPPDHHPVCPPGGARAALFDVSEMVENLLPDQVMPIGRLAAAQATADVRVSNPVAYYNRLRVAFCCFAREMDAAGQL